MMTFRKERILGLWVNADSRVLENAPAYLAVLSNRPLDAVTNTETLRRLQLGLDNIPLLQRASVNIADAASDDPFRVAFRTKVSGLDTPRIVRLPTTETVSGPVGVTFVVRNVIAGWFFASKN